METIDELTAFLTTATVDGILGRLLYRGAAWSLMREEGVLPQNAPPLGATIETDLAEHGFALLRGAMALRAKAGELELTSKAFERAANAFEALVRNGNPDAPDRGLAPLRPWRVSQTNVEVGPSCRGTSHCGTSGQGTAKTRPGGEKARPDIGDVPVRQCDVVRSGRNGDQESGRPD